jgi:hypothetical protein
MSACPQGTPRRRRESASVAGVTQPRLRIKTTPDVLAAIPYLLGFHPADCIVVLALRDRRVLFVMRHDLSDVDPGMVADLLIEHGTEDAFVVGYGEQPQVVGVAPAVAGALRLAGIAVIDEVRVTAGRYWSLSAGGEPCDFDSTVVAATATFHGLSVLPDRASLVAQLAPVAGPERAAMAAATVRAEARRAEWGKHGLSGARLAKSVRRAGFAAVRTAETRTGGRLTDDEVAWLGVLLVDDDVCDYAWQRSEPTDDDRVTWTDITRRVEQRYVPAPATLLSFVLWRLGRGPTAGAAIDRALAADPAYELARSMDRILCLGVDPVTVTAWPGRRAA